MKTQPEFGALTTIPVHLVMLCAETALLDFESPVGNHAPANDAQPTRNTTPYSVISLFSGCGGMDLGFTGGFEVFNRFYERLPFEVIWANDLSPAACRTYKHNLSHNIVCGDIWASLDSMPDYADIVIGGFPCQDISINGKRMGVAGSRSGLYRAMVEAIDRVRPKIFVAENVRGLLLDYNKDSLRAVLNDFGSLGYTLSYHLYLAANYGVPQMRQRVFIVGTSPDVRSFEKPESVVDSRSWMSSQAAISDLETLEEDITSNHIWSRAAVSPDQGNRRIKAHLPSDTIRAECHGNIQFHYSLPRRLSMREAARLQSFPDSFVFQSKLRETERQIGNAVPPVLAWQIARAIAGCLA